MLQLAMSWLRTLLRVGSRAQKLVGSDLAGNQYFEQLVEGGKSDICCMQLACPSLKIILRESLDLGIKLEMPISSRYSLYCYIQILKFYFLYNIYYTKK